MNKNISNWLEATRPKTLSAGIVPVIIANAIAFHYDKFNFAIAIITLICSVLIQISTNFFNEIYDFKRGADGDKRIGPRRQVASGNISQKLMMNVTIFIVIITFALGMILVKYAGLTILWIGIASLIFSYLYTGGPYPLAYKGLGDIFVFLFFGVIAVNGAFYVQTQNFYFIVLLASFAPGLLSANILNVNNIRDVITDPEVGKITLAVRIGEGNAKLMYVFSTIFCYVLQIIIFVLLNKLVLLLPLLSLPLAIKLCIDIYKKKGKELNKVLALTGVLLFLFGLLNSFSFILFK